MGANAWGPSLSGSNPSPKAATNQSTSAWGTSKSIAQGLCTSPVLFSRLPTPNYSMQWWADLCDVCKHDCRGLARQHMPLECLAINGCVHSCMWSYLLLRLIWGHLKHSAPQIWHVYQASSALVSRSVSTRVLLSHLQMRISHSSLRPPGV